MVAHTGRDTSAIHIAETVKHYFAHSLIYGLIG